MSQFTLRTPAEQTRLGLTSPPPAPQAPTERHRPRELSSIVGQGGAVWRLKEFLECPYSTAFLFEGETGTGKTTAALCLAAELGAVEFGGLDRIKAGMQDAEAVERVLDTLRFTPMLGSGWKVVIVDESDWMSPKAAQLWLSALEDLPTKSIVVFTTNHPGKFQDRFLDRCERIAFESSAANLRQDAEALIAKVWTGEGRTGEAPRLDQLNGVIDGLGNLSFRRVVQAVAAYRPGQTRPVPVAKPVIRPTIQTLGGKDRGAAARKAWETRRRKMAESQV
jgi:hypothetical protein